MADIHDNLPQIRTLINELNDIAVQRKDCVDRLWVLEDQGERKRHELMNLLGHP